MSWGELSCKEAHFHIVLDLWESRSEISADLATHHSDRLCVWHAPFGSSIHGTLHCLCDKSVLGLRVVLGMLLCHFSHSSLLSRPLRYRKLQSKLEAKSNMENEIRQSEWKASRHVTLGYHSSI